MKRQVIILLLAMAVLQMALATQASAVNAYIRPNNFVFHVGFVNNQINVIEDSIELMNKDNFSVIVELTAEDGLEGMTQFPYNSIVLQPNQTYDAYFLIFLPHSGGYSGIIRPTYRAQEGWSYPNGILYADVTITATSNGTATNIYQPREFGLLSPPNGYGFQSGTLTLQWEEAEDPDGNPVIYYYRIDDNQDFSSPEYSGMTLSTEKQLEAVLGDGTYYWNVIASDGPHNRTSSDTRTITAGGGPNPFCGDGICNGGEGCSSCLQDCGACPNGSDCSELEERIEQLEREIESLKGNVTALWEDDAQKWAAIDMVKSAVCRLFGILGLVNPFWTCPESGITCSSNSDCGTSGLVGSRYCTNNDAYRDYRTYTCSSPGTEDSYCSHSDTPTLVQDCPDACSNGQCTSSDIACYTGPDCGASGYVGSNYCQGGDAYRNYRTYACNSPGTVNSYCSDSDAPVLQEECGGLQCADGACVQPSGEVIFRTNAVGGDYKYGTWIAYDTDGDGDLDPMLGRSLVTIRCGECVITDYFGKCMMLHNGYPVIKISEGGSYCTGRKYDTIYYGAQTSLSPTEPYASNHQEVYA